MQCKVPFLSRVTVNTRIPKCKTCSKRKRNRSPDPNWNRARGRITSEDVIEAPKPEVQAPPQEPQIEKVSQETTAQPSVPFAARKTAEQLGVDLTQVKASDQWKNNQTRCFRPQQNAWYTTTNTNTNFIAYRSRWKQNTNKGNESNHRRPYALFTTRNGATHPNHGC